MPPSARRTRGPRGWPRRRCGWRPRSAVAAACACATPSSPGNSPNTVGPEPETIARTAPHAAHVRERVADRRAQRPRGRLEVVVQQALGEQRAVARRARGPGRSDGRDRRSAGRGRGGRTPHTPRASRACAGRARPGARTAPDRRAAARPRRSRSSGTARGRAGKGRRRRARPRSPAAPRRTARCRAPAAAAAAASRRAAAASADPPPMPPATGTRLAIEIRTGGPSQPVCARNAASARPARFSPSTPGQTTSSASPPAGSSSSSSASETGWTSDTSGW